MYWFDNLEWPCYFYTRQFTLFQTTFTVTHNNNSWKEKKWDEAEVGRCKLPSWHFQYGKWLANYNMQVKLVRFTWRSNVNVKNNGENWLFTFQFSKWERNTVSCCMSIFFCCSVKKIVYTLQTGSSEIRHVLLSLLQRRSRLFKHFSTVHLQSWKKKSGQKSPGPSSEFYNSVFGKRERRGNEPPTPTNPLVLLSFDAFDIWEFYYGIFFTMTLKYFQCQIDKTSQNITHKKKFKTVLNPGSDPYLGFGSGSGATCYFHHLCPSLLIKWSRLHSKNSNFLY